MITPRPAASMCGSSCFIDRNTPRVLVRCTLFQSSTDCSCIGAAPGVSTPALLNATSILP